MSAAGTSVRTAAVRHERTLVRVLRALAVLALAVDVQVHLELAPIFDAFGSQVTQGGLFRVEAALAAAAAL